KVFCSISFSVPRCRRPICGSTRATTSPSSSSTRRNTPCAAGCCGPKLMVKLRRFCGCSFMSQLPLHGELRIANSEWRNSFGLRFRFLVAGQGIVRPFPWRHEIEFPEFLVEPDRLVQHPLFLVVV